MPNVYISLGVHGFFRDAPTTLTITLGYRNRSVLVPCIFGSQLPETGTVLVFAPCIFGFPISWNRNCSGSYNANTFYSALT